MEMKIDRRFIYKVLILFLCVYLALLPAFCYKKADAAFDKTRAYITIVTEIIMALRGVGFISDTTLTPENLENIYNKADAYLHENFGTELEYAEALRQVDQLGLDIASGQIFVPGNYSGKLWYSFLKGVVDVVWPYTGTFPTSPPTGSGKYILKAIIDGKKVEEKDDGNTVPRIGWRLDTLNDNGSQVAFVYGDPSSIKMQGQMSLSSHFMVNGYTLGVLRYTDYSSGTHIPQNVYSLTVRNYHEPEVLKTYLGLSTGYVQFVNIYAKTANKVKLPTRLPQTVINNINNYIDNSTENLIIAPTSDELPQLPDNYNPVTDDPPDLDGYQDVTPDQEPSGLPEPTPTPTPTPTPLPEDPTPSDFYQFLTTLASNITAFFTVMVNFLGDLFSPPTETVNLDLLTEIPDTAFTKFPFSMPTDFKRILSVVQAKGECPDFTLTIPMSKINLGGDIDYHIELSQWETGAKVVRIALLISFCIGLLLITKKLIWGA